MGLGFIIAMRLFSVSVLLAMSCGSTRKLSQAELLHEPPRRLALAAAEPRTMVRVEGVELAVHDTHGDGPVIVCLHAIAHGGGDFAAFEAAFRARYRIITVDWPGQGASGLDTQPASAHRYATLLDGLLTALGLERAVLFGNSIGGAAAIDFALSHPERVRALILCNPGGLDPGGLLASLSISHLESRFAWGAAGEERFHDWFADYYRGVLKADVAAERRRAVVESGYEVAPRLVEAWHSFAQAQAYLGDRLAALRLPVFVGWAADDEIVQWKRNAAAIATLPNATVVQFAGAGHAAFLETPDAFNAAIAPFLEKQLIP